MKTGDAFRANQAALEESLRQAATADEATAAIRVAFERTAALMAQEETDEVTRQRVQAVLAVAKESGSFLRSAHAEGKLVADQSEEEESGQNGINRTFQYFGLGILATLVVYELINGAWVLAFMAVIGALLVYIGLNGTRPDQAQKWKAEGTVHFDSDRIVRTMFSVCEAIDIAVQDLAIIDSEQTVRKVSGQEEALLDFVSALLEAKESGRADLVADSVAEAEQTLRRIGIQAVRYSPENTAMFDLLPTVGPSRTVRPALLNGDRIIRRGVAAVQMQEVGR